MHGRAVKLCASLQNALVRIQTLEIRQQGRVNVENAPLPFLEKIGGEQAHEARQAHDVDLIPFKECLNCLFKTTAILAELGVVDDFCIDVGGFRDHQATGVRPVGYYQRDFGGIVSIFCSLYEGRHIRAAAGDEHSDAFATHGLTEIEKAVINNT